MIEVPDPVEFPSGWCEKSTHIDGGHCTHWRYGDGDCCRCSRDNDLDDDGKCRHIEVYMRPGALICERCGKEAE